MSVMRLRCVYARRDGIGNRDGESSATRYAEEADGVTGREDGTLNDSFLMKNCVVNDHLVSLGWAAE